ncbi:hypothetical protein Acr_15g0005270 [Actinidia rufa]|uniref:Reverse transcriptase domain-containing protein n=1 Tax=Actinidia rufa TaxID=165716 RepID=A0A7J0FVF7_9ERIC|nr:hypothetical protein Acr_15g0005270 [Actinidia rufa]
MSLVNVDRASPHHVHYDIHLGQKGYFGCVHGCANLAMHFPNSLQNLIFSEIVTSLQAGVTHHVPDKDFTHSAPVGSVGAHTMLSPPYVTTKPEIGGSRLEKNVSWSRTTSFAKEDPSILSPEVRLKSSRVQTLHCMYHFLSESCYYTEHRNKKEGKGKSKEDLEFPDEPIFAKALARTEVMPVGWVTGTSGTRKKIPVEAPIIIRELPIRVSATGVQAISPSTDNKEVVEEESENEEVEEESVNEAEEESEKEVFEEDSEGVGNESLEVLEENSSRSLGVEDSDSCPDVVQKDKKGESTMPSPVKQTWASFFTGKNQRTEGTTLQKVEIGKGPIKILEKDVEKAASRWQHTFVGYFGGRFPGKKTLDKIVASWKVRVNVHHHSSGWIIFEFSEEGTKNKVLHGGPYMIFGRPLLLKVMTKFFAFEDEVASCFPIWIRLMHLPLSLWDNGTLAKTCSGIGNPICVDEYTTRCGRTSYARVLVEIDMANELGRVHRAGVALWENSYAAWQDARVTEKGKDAQDSQVARPSVQVTDKALHQEHSVIPNESQETLQEWRIKLGQPQNEPQEKIPKTYVLATDLGASEKPRKNSQRVQGQSQEENPETQAQGTVSTQDHNQSSPRGRGETEHMQPNLRVQIIRRVAAQNKGTTQTGRRSPAVVTATKSMIASSWNIRGLKTPLKQNGIFKHVKKNKVVVMGILETKIRNHRIMERIKKKFRDWEMADNFQHFPNGRILMIIWKGDMVDLEIKDSNAQVVERRPLWRDLCRFSSSIDLPWILLGDFNVVLKGEEKANGLPVTQYEVKDFQECCYETSVEDLRFTGLFYTWTNNSVWRKLDRAMVNHRWLREGFPVMANFGLPGKFSDHSPCVVILFENQEYGKVLPCLDYAKKLKGLKDPLRKLNRNHFFHISTRAEVAEKDLHDVQQLLHDNPRDESLKSRVAELRRNKEKNQIVSLIDANGAATTSPKQPVSDEEIKSALWSIGDEKASRLDGLSPILEKLIDPAQSAFVPNRSMVENIYMVQELLRKYSRKRISRRCIMKVDLRKAYDTVNWGFLEDTLVGLKFPGLFVNWIMQCVTTTSYSISINGTLHGFFKGEQGLRQGDPLSPFLFAICLEVLSRKFSRLSRNPQFKHHPRCSELSITHLAFADDLILFTRGDVASVRLSMECLENFGECSGLCINYSKSNVYMAGLGIPVASSKLTIEQFSPLVLKISEYISAWAGSCLSYAGRSELIKNFLWGGKTTSNKKPLVAWKDVCRPKNEGGLGFIDLSAWNMALLSKALWNLQSKKDSLWVKWVNQVYKKDLAFWEYVPKKQDSQIVRYIGLIRDKIVLEVGNREAALDRLNQWVEQDRFNVKACYEFFRSKGALEGRYLEDVLLLGVVFSDVDHMGSCTVGLDLSPYKYSLCWVDVVDSGAGFSNTGAKGYL